MSQNKNYANFYDYDTGRTKTKVNQQPGFIMNLILGGNSSLSLAWDAEPMVRNNIRNSSVPKSYQDPGQQTQVINQQHNKINRYQSPYQQTQQSSQYSQQEQQQNVPPYQPSQSQQYQLSQHQNSQQQQPQQYQQPMPQQQTTQQSFQSQQYSNVSRRTEYNMGADGSERTSVRVAQQPGGNSNIIFGEYNHFKDDQASSKKPPRANQFARSSQQPQQFSPLQNTYSNVINNFSSNQQEHRPYQTQQFEQRNQVRVNQPPGGKSNFTIG